jgi:kynurenine formamidase
MTEMRFRHRPRGSNWGDFGPDDQRGRLNLLTPEHVRRARDEIVTGESFCLALPMTLPGGKVLSPMREPPRLHVTNPDGRPRFNHPPHRHNGWTDFECDDFAVLSLQYSTHWDALAHMGGFFDADGDGHAEQVFYNGFRAGTDVVPHDGAPGLGKGALALGIENAAQKPIVGRAVLVDLQAHYGRETGPVHVSLDMLQAAMPVAPEAGDMLLLHTGFSDLLIDMNGDPDKARMEAATIALDGRDDALLEWIADSNLVAIASDNFAVEAYPALAPKTHPTAELPLHELCLFKLGIMLGELWNLGPITRAMAKQDRYRLFLSAPPLNLPGAVASPLTPVGIL